jgi:hypothetical protein
LFWPGLERPVMAVNLVTVPHRDSTSARRTVSTKLVRVMGKDESLEPLWTRIARG